MCLLMLQRARQLAAEGRLVGVDCCTAFVILSFGGVLFGWETLFLPVQNLHTHTSSRATCSQISPPQRVPPHS